MTSRYARVPEALLDDDRLTPSAVVVYAVLERFAGRKGAAYVSREALAERSRLSEVTVKRAMTVLTDAGWISRRRRGGNVWETVVNEAPVEPVRRVTSDPYGGSPVTHTAGHSRPATSGAAGQKRPLGGSKMTPRRVTSDPPKEGTKLDEPNSMNQLIDAADATSTPKTALAIVADPAPPDALLDVTPIGPTQAQVVQALVAAYAEAWRESAGVYPPSRKCAALGRSVKPLLAEGWEPAILLRAVQRAGAARNLNVDGQLGEAQTAAARGGSTRAALFAAWDARIATRGPL